MYKCGLVLEGGGTRAMYTSGVLDAFMEDGIDFDYVIGVSAGSCNGASFIAKNIHRQHDITIDYVNDKRYMGIESLIKHGEFLNCEWIFDELSYDLMPINLERYKSSKTPLVAVMTNANTGEAEYVVADDIEARGCWPIHASCALPIATRGVEHEGSVYYDGGIIDSIPAKHAIEDGCKKEVVILTQHDSYVKQPIKAKKIINAAFKKEYPALATAILNRHNMYNEQLRYVRNLENEGTAYVIRPAKPLECSTLEKNVDKLEKIYQLGYKQGKENAKAIKQFMAE